MRIVGLDLSLTSTGVAFGDDTTGTVHTQAIKSKLHGTARLVEIREHVLGIVLFPFVADVVVVEGYAFGSPRGASNAHSLGELGGVIKLALYEHQVPVVIAPPASVKKFACDAGNAPKVEVLVAAVKASGLDFSTSDEADAYWLREMGCHRYGAPSQVMPTAYRSAAIAKVDWPDIEEHTHA